MNIEGLTPELKEKALSCKTPEELLALAYAYRHGFLWYIDSHGWE